MAAERKLLSGLWPLGVDHRASQIVQKTTALHFAPPAQIGSENKGKEPLAYRGETSFKTLCFAPSLDMPLLPGRLDRSSTEIDGPSD